MSRILISNRGSTLIIILMMIVVLGLLVPAGYIWYNKLFLNENRIIHQKQAVNLTVSAMETFKRQENIAKIDYLTKNTYTPENPLTVTKETSMLDLYQYAEDGEGSRFTIDQLKNHTGEYTVVVRGISGDLNHDQQKNANEPFFYEHKMTAVEMVANGEVLIEKKENGTVVETKWMSFQEFLEKYNQPLEKGDNGKGNGHCKHDPNHNGNGNSHEKDKDCEEEDGKIIDGDVTIFSVGPMNESLEKSLKMFWEESWGSWPNIFITTDSIFIEAKGSITLTGSYALTTIAKKPPSFIKLKSIEGDVSIYNTGLISTGKGRGTKRFLNIEAPKGQVTLENSILYANKAVQLTAVDQQSFLLKNIFFPMYKHQVNTTPNVMLDKDFFP